VPHRGEQLPDQNRLAAFGTRRHALGETVPDRLNRLGQLESTCEMLLRRPARLGVDDPVSGQVLDELPGHATKVRC
jgi:hypothetical protein